MDKRRTLVRDVAISVSLLVLQ